MLVIASSTAMYGCSDFARNEPCHSYSDCPGYIYAWTPKFVDPNNLGTIDVEGEPQLLAASIAVYPGVAWRNQLEGFAVFEFDVSAAGKPINIRVIESHPGDTFVDAGVNAIKLSKYTKTKNGVTGLRRRFAWTVDGKPPKSPIQTTT